MPQFQSLSAQAPTVGVAQCAWGETNNAADFKAPPTVVAKAEPFVVDPELPDNANQPGYFPTLESAVAVAETKKDDTVILIKSNDLVRVQSVRLKKTSRTVTVRPYEGYRPVLTLDTEGAVGDAALFEVHRGTIVLKDLSVLLHPERKEPAAQSVIALGCQGQCRFEGCLITLRPKHKEVSLSGVTFAGPVNGGNEPKVPGPRVELVDILVRGEGVFLNFGKALPFELDAKNSLVFLSGSLVQAQINYPVKNVMVGKSTIKLSRCTFYTREPLLQLSDEIKGDGGLITTTVLPSDCMFTTDASPLPLLQFTSSSSAATVGKLYGWGGVHNVYCGFDTILYQSGSSGGAALDVKKSAWQMKESMDGTHFLEKTFDFQTVGDPVLADIRPEDVQTMVTDLHKHLNDNKGTVLVNNYGANLGQLKEILPLPKVTAPLAPKAPEETGLVKP